MKVQANFATPGGIAELIVRGLFITATGYVLYRVFSDPNSFQDSKELGSAILVTAVASILFAYSAYHLLSVFFQSIRYEQKQVILTSLFSKKVFPRDSFQEMWLDAHIPKFIDWVAWPGIWRSWRNTNFSLGFDGKSDNLGEYRIGRAWDIKAVRTLISSINADKGV